MEPCLAALTFCHTSTPQLLQFLQRAIAATSDRPKSVQENAIAIRDRWHCRCSIPKHVQSAGRARDDTGRGDHRHRDPGRRGRGAGRPLVRGGADVGSRARAFDRDAPGATRRWKRCASSAATSSPSPANAWAVDTPGYIEYLDQHGKLVAGRAGGVYVRRWSITPLPADANLLAVQVAVAPCRTMPGATRCGDAGARVRLASVRSRVAW